MRTPAHVLDWAAEMPTGSLADTLEGVMTDMALDGVDYADLPRRERLALLALGREAARRGLADAPDVRAIRNRRWGPAAPTPRGRHAGAT